MSNWTGRAVKRVFWTTPVGAVKYTLASNMALASDLGRRWITFVVFGAYLWGFRWITVHLVPPLRVVSAVLLLLWFLHGVHLVRWTWRARAYAARQRAIQRQDHAILEQLPEMIQRSLMAAYQAGGDNVRDYGPAHAQTQQMERTQAEQVRGWVDDGTGEPPPTGEWVPVTPLPRWLRRRMRKRGPK